MKMSWRDKALVVFLGMAGIQLARAEEFMEFSCPTPGTKITTARGTLTIRESEGFSCRAEGGRGLVDSYALIHPLTEAQKRDPAHAKVIDPIHVERLWPLAVGKRHKGSATIGQRTFYLEYAVTGQELIETPMGKQNTFVIELNETSTGDYWAKGKWWISPRFSFAIQGEFRNSMSGASSFQVTAVEEAGK